jgi:hypothetical protein
VLADRVADSALALIIATSPKVKIELKGEYMKINKKMASVSLAAVIGLAGIGTIGTVSAATENGRAGFMEKLATRFNLDKSEVTEFMSEQKAEKQAEYEAKASEHLQSLVDEGKLTAEQKTALEEYRAESQSARESQKSELEAWAEENGIDLKYLMSAKRGVDKLESAVDSRDITIEQKTLVEEKQSELKADREASKTARDAWAEENGIDLSLLKDGGSKNGRGHGGPRGR